MEGEERRGNADKEKEMGRAPAMIVSSGAYKRYALDFVWKAKYRRSITCTRSWYVCTAISFNGFLSARVQGFTKLGVTASTEKRTEEEEEREKKKSKQKKK